MAYTTEGPHVIVQRQKNLNVYVHGPFINRKKAVDIANKLTLAATLSQSDFIYEVHGLVPFTG
jgi:hypothetical protein